MFPESQSPLSSAPVCCGGGIDFLEQGSMPLLALAVDLAEQSEGVELRGFGRIFSFVTLKKERRKQSCHERSIVLCL